MGPAGGHDLPGKRPVHGLLSAHHHGARRLSQECPAPGRGPQKADRAASPGQHEPRGNKHPAAGARPAGGGAGEAAGTRAHLPGAARYHRVRPDEHHRDDEGIPRALPQRHGEDARLHDQGHRAGAEGTGGNPQRAAHPAGDHPAAAVAHRLRGQARCGVQGHAHRGERALQQHALVPRGGNRFHHLSHRPGGHHERHSPRECRRDRGESLLGREEDRRRHPGQRKRGGGDQGRDRARRHTREAQPHRGELSVGNAAGGFVLFAWIPVAGES